MSAAPVPDAAAAVLVIENSYVERFNSLNALGAGAVGNVILATRQMEAEVDAALAALGWPDTEIFEAALDAYVQTHHGDVRVEHSYSENLYLAAKDATS